MVQSLHLKVCGKGFVHMSPKNVKASRQRLHVSNAIGFENAPIEAIVGGGVLVVGSLAFLASEALKATQVKDANPQGQSTPVEDVQEPLRRENAVLVFGASGRSGREIVTKVC
jgi:hypothetical protein